MAAADNEWQGTTGLWTTAGNWSDAVPDASDRVRINSTAMDITAGDAQSAITVTELQVGAGFVGTCHTAALPLYIGATNFRYAARQCTSFNLRLAACTSFLVNDTHPTVQSLYLLNSTITTGIVQGGIGAVFDGASSAITTLVVQRDITDLTKPAPMVKLASGVPLTNLYVLDGVVRVQNRPTNIYVGFGATVYIEGTTTGTITLVDQWGGMVYYNSKLTIITTYNGRRGFLDMSQSADEKRIATINAYSGWDYNANNGQGTNDIGTVNNFGFSKQIEPFRAMTPAAIN